MKKFYYFHKISSENINLFYTITTTIAMAFVLIFSNIFCYIPYKRFQIISITHINKFVNNITQFFRRKFTSFLIVNIATKCCTTLSNFYFHYFFFLFCLLLLYYILYTNPNIIFNMRIFILNILYENGIQNK